jgi:NAD(P)-dependent dehydrogenase (short-subunit alcohol dehydrogenase family)
MTMAISHFGHFYLTYLLFPYIKTAPEARIINVSSVTHIVSKLSTSEDLNCEYDFDSVSQYARSKLANVQLNAGLAARLSLYPNIKAMSLNPVSYEPSLMGGSIFLTLLKISLCSCCYQLVGIGSATNNLYLSQIPFQELKSG